MTKAPTNFDDVIDSRDIIDRIEEIQTELEEAGEAYDLEKDETFGAAHDRGDLVTLREELERLQKLAEEGANYAADWEYGETLIRDSYFEDYARELVEDCGYVPKDLPQWIEIDWQATARNVRADYTSIDFGGVTYWIR